MRRQLFPALVAIVLFTAMTLLYSLGTTAAVQVLFHHKAEGSLVTNARGRVVGSSLIGQDFTKPGYFHPRPAADAYASGPDYSYGSNYGPTNPLLIGNVPGVSITDKTNAYATSADPYCVPVQSEDKAGDPVSDRNGNPVYDRNPDGSYVCNPDTVPERVIAYRKENGLAPDATVPVDAVTASASGLDPDISVANAMLQAKRVAAARKVSVEAASAAHPCQHR